MPIEYFRERDTLPIGALDLRGLIYRNDPLQSPDNHRDKIRGMTTRNNSVYDAHFPLGGNMEFGLLGQGWCGQGENGKRTDKKEGFHENIVLPTARRGKGALHVGVIERFGLGSGAYFRLLGFQPDLRRGVVDLTLLGTG